MSGLHGELGQNAQQMLRAPARDAESAAVYLMEATRRRRSAASLRTVRMNFTACYVHGRTAALHGHVALRSLQTSVVVLSSTTF